MAATAKMCEQQGQKHTAENETLTSEFIHTAIVVTQRLTVELDTKIVITHGFLLTAYKRCRYDFRFHYRGGTMQQRLSENELH
jgi:hypothetical protein